jgi:hypothetical protein
MSNTSEFPHAAESWAEVRAHDQVVRYRRSGSGRSILLLCPDAAVDAPWPGLTMALARDFRVLTPAVPLDSQLMRGLTGFLEGLGTSRIAIVATGELCVAALELALLDRDRVARAVLVPGEGAGLEALRAALATRSDLLVPLLMLPCGTAADSAIARIGAFLADGWG